MILNSRDRGANSEKPALKFHSIHGKNIRRELGGCRVVRTESFCDGIVFSNRAISVDERVSIRQAATSDIWSGVLRFGVTNTDPASHRSLDLPRFACPNLTRLPGYWITALPDRYARQGCVVQFYVTRQGDIHYSINGSSKGIFLSGISTASPLWVILDVYGTATAVEFNTSFASSTDEPIRSLQRQLASNLRLNSPPPLLPRRGSMDGTPTRRPTICRSIFNLTRLRRVGSVANERDTAPTPMHQDSETEFSRTSETMPAPPRIPAPATPTPLQTFSFNRANAVMAREGMAAARTSHIPRVMVSSSIRRPQMNSALGQRLFSSETREMATSRVDDLPFYRRIGQFREGAAREGNDDIEFALVPPSPGLVSPPREMPIEMMSSSTTRSQTTSSSMARAPTTEVAGYLRLQEMTSSSASTAITPLAAFFSSQNETRSSSREASSPADDCSICMEAPVNSVIYKCGHMCMCYPCAVKIKKSGCGCPICRMPMKDVIKTYKS